VTAEYSDQRPYVGYQAFRAEVDDWISAATSGAEPSLSGRSVLPVVRLIDECYRRRTPIAEPWTDEGMVAGPSTVHVESGHGRVLVTGAGGFLGGRAVELLSGKHGWEVVALVREPRSAARLARWTHPIVVGDICSAADMDRALKGCDAVVHCAVGTSWEPDAVRKVTVEGTRTLAEAALRAGVKRFVHISTMFVHRRDGNGVLDETVALEPPAGDRYGQNKLLAEKAVQAATARGLHSIILRPTRIYGPFSRTFTVRPLEAIAAGQFAIRGNQDVPANMTYVDNVVDAIAHALEAADRLSGSAYLINDPEQLSLREFYEFFARTAGKAIRAVADDGATGHVRRKSGVLTPWLSALRTIARSSELRGLVRRVMDTDPIGTLPRRLWNLSPNVQQSLLRRFGADAAVIYRPNRAGSSSELVYYGDPLLVSSAKAERELGFVPPVNRPRAMALTLAWAQYARLLPMVDQQP
jgi:nucleoside-diphosphate-sugar epimerase